MSPKDDFTQLLRNSDEAQHYTAGSTICRAGDPGHTMYVVITGQVEIRVGDHVIETVSDGGILGEMALVDAGDRSADMVAMTDCELVPITEKRFQFLVQQTPFFALRVMRVLVQRLRAMNHHSADPVS